MFPATNNYCNVVLEFKRVKDRERKGEERKPLCALICVSVKMCGLALIYVMVFLAGYLSIRYVAYTAVTCNETAECHGNYSSVAWSIAPVTQVLQVNGKFRRMVLT